MIASIVHLLACVILVAAACYRIMKAGPAPDAHRFLFPYIVVAALTGLVAFYVNSMELFVAYYSGSDPAAAFRLNGPYWWVYSSLAFVPLLPGAGILPWIGGRAVWVAALGVLATLPKCFLLVGGLIHP